MPMSLLPSVCTWRRRWGGRWITPPTSPGNQTASSHQPQRTSSEGGQQELEPETEPSLGRFVGSNKKPKSQILVGGQKYRKSPSQRSSFFSLYTDIYTSTSGNNLRPNFITIDEFTSSCSSRYSPISQLELAKTI